VQEATLTFAPKLIAFSCVSLLLAPWLLHSLTEYTVAIFARMTAMAH
jgi:flagellar biosynthesis protein FliQ